MELGIWNAFAYSAYAPFGPTKSLDNPRTKLASRVLFEACMSHPCFEDGQDIRDRSFLFACSVVRLCQVLYDCGGVARLLVPQLVNAATSSATMLEEARAAESDADFISKCGISLKECRESWTRLRICVECQLGPVGEARRLAQEANELISIVTAIIRNKRRNVAAKAAAEPRRLSRSSKTPTPPPAFPIPNS